MPVSRPNELNREYACSAEERLMASCAICIRNVLHWILYLLCVCEGSRLCHAHTDFILRDVGYHRDSLKDVLSMEGKMSGSGRSID